MFCNDCKWNLTFLNCIKILKNKDKKKKLLVSANFLGVGSELLKNLSPIFTERDFMIRS